MAAGAAGPARAVDAVTGAILAGGRSTRMGTNKALLAVDGLRLIDRAAAALGRCFPEVLIVANDPAPYAGMGLPVVADLVPGKGSLGGLYTAVTAAAHPYAFCLACDMPFANPALIRYLAGLAPGHDAVVPRTDDGLQPLHAVYGKGCLPAMRRLIEVNRLKIDGLFPQVRVRYPEEGEMRPFDPDLLSFWNLNTRDDLAQAHARAAGRMARD